LSKRILFISDLHLEESRPDITDALLAFLNRNKASCGALYILGDLFETWIGDDDRSTLSDTVADALTEFQQAGSSIYLLHGNRDFLIGNEYANRCGASLIHDSTVINSPAGPILVLHGDDLCTDDIEYLQFRDLVRQPTWQQEFLSKPLPERRAFAEQARQQSKNATASKDNSIMDVNAGAVEKRLIEQGQSLMIHGHTHRPQVHELQLSHPVAGSHEARRVVLGDWDKNGWFIEVSSEGLKLEQFPL
jgi:UDP-2,3-diacylglucosamine hydrolase